LALLDEVGLRDRADSLPRELSGGMAQRVSLSRGLYRNPEILLLDEPFSTVDALTRMKLQISCCASRKPTGLQYCLSPTTWTRQFISPTGFW